ncbi:leucine--tRNA ligase [Candidatus Woesearchaeota archaeon]|nr:MAG: leucine--tRNA ligase [Candidatus Woesearchaeota archaeon]
MVQDEVVKKHIEIRDKWIKKWQEARIFEANPDNREKFFVNFPYPYVNAYAHLGHLFTLTRVDVFARYKRMRGYNVLFPQGWHCTGSPIETAALRIKEREEKQWRIMRDMGFTDEEIERFADPLEWVRYFPKEFKKDFTNMGAGIDWRREFITTELNPYYDRFIKWQFRKLREKGFIVKGKHPVVWCPNCNRPIGDHARLEGEGEVPQEFTLLKFPVEGEDYMLIAATLRPETVFGQTNLWVHPRIEYVKARINNETWVLSKEAAIKLEQQGRRVEILGTVKGEELIGKKAIAPMIHKAIPILPSYFCSPERGTGIVTSVPSDAPDDYIGLKDLWNNPEECEKYGLDPEEVRKIEIVKIIDSKDLGDEPAVRIVEEWGIKNQHEREKLEKAKKLVYKKGFYEGVMKKNLPLVGGMPVEKAKEVVKKHLIDKNEADIMYELSGRVVCRCGTEGIVKIVEDQWFLNYSNPEWKRLAHEALDNLKLYPESIREQFHYVIDWLNDWACTREYGLGSRLPWDEKWVIESLSDSTVYMAYYTISHKIKELPLEEINDEFFDYVFLGIGKPKRDEWRQLREEFLYWYPFDFRNSGKDLLNNHLPFMLFNHTAIFPREYWPRGIGINGFLTVDGEKMSKSKGNFLLMRQVVEQYGPDTTRITILSGGEGIDDCNWDSKLAESMKTKLLEWLESIEKLYDKGASEKRRIDEWMLSRINKAIIDTTNAMEETLFRTAIQRAFFDYNKDLSWYLRRTRNKPNREIINKALETQVLLLAPIIPFMAEEAWSRIGKQGFVSIAQWPKAETNAINPVLDKEEEMVAELLRDIAKAKDLAKIEQPREIILIGPDEWLYDFITRIEEILERTKNPREIIGELKKDYADRMQIVVRLVKRAIKQKLGISFKNWSEEREALMDVKDFLEEEFKAKIVVLSNEEAKNSEEEILKKKAEQALPGKPAILLR